MSLDNNTLVFLELVRAGLWEKEARLEQYGKVDFEEIYRLAGEQSVVGLVTVGFEQVQDVKAPQEIVLQCIGESLQLEQTNKAMNQFIEKLVGKMREANIYTLLVKGQGVAQCYERPLWRASGDIDLLLSASNHRKAISLLVPLSSSHKNGGDYSKEYAVTIDDWMIELHGSLRTGLSGRVDKMVDDVLKDVFYGGNVRSWDNNGTTVFLPAADNDVFFVFTHFIKHFYKEGTNLRQICDWCRILWTYRESLNYELLESWITKSGLMGEWKAFYNLASRYLSMPDLDSRLMAHNSRFDKKAEKLMEFILGGYSGNKIKDTLQIAKIFPWKALRYSPSIFLNVNWLKVRERLFK